MFPYENFPTFNEWKTDSTVKGIWPSTFRVYDSTLGIIDELVRHYNDPNADSVKIETLFYLVDAINYWQKNVNKDVSNKNDADNLPVTQKVKGHDNRKSAMSALKMIAGDLLTDETDTHTLVEAVDALKPNYSRASHGNVDNTDQHQIEQVQAAGEVAVFLQEKHLQRKYKLRFRDGSAWRWSSANGQNEIYDTTDNSESEINDQKTHFVMNTRGHIFAGFNKAAMWFKHSSLIGGANAYSAGRIKIVAGKVKIIVNDSGHYHPGVQQMRNILHRLRLYGQDISGITIERIQPDPSGSFSSSQIVATTAGTWPDGVVEE